MNLRAIIVLLIICFSVAKKLNSVESTCEINSHVIAVDNLRKDKYDLLITLSTDGECKLDCKFSNAEITVVETDSYNFSGRWYYFFRASNLENMSKYKYNCGTENLTISYDVQFPKNKSKTKVLTFGDWSQHLNGLKFFDYLNKILPNNTYDAFVTLGDYSYNLSNDEDESWNNGNSFFKWIENISSALPFMMNAGNHEYIKKDFTDYIKRFLMPNKDKTQNLYYSFDINDVHFVSVTSEFGLIDYKGKEYYDTFKQWFRDDLISTTKQWRVVYLHRPLYCSWVEKPRCTVEAAKLRNFFEDLFYESQVDLILSGHLHNYERLYPIYKGEVDDSSISADQNVYTNPKYPSHLICGTAGNKEGTTPLYQPSKLSKFVTDQAGVCELNFINNKLIVNFVNTENELVDSFQIVKNKIITKPVKKSRLK